MTQKEYQKEYYRKNKESILKRQREYRKECLLKNKEDILKRQREYQKEYRLKNKEILAAKLKIFYQENKESILKKQKEWRDKNLANRREKDKEYRLKNKDKIQNYNKKYKKSIKDFNDSQKSYSYLYSQLKFKYKNAAALNESDIIALDKLKNKRDAYYELRKKIQVYLKKPSQNIYDEFDLPHYT